MCERYIDWLPLKRPQLGTCPATQACALTRNQTSNFLVCRPVLSPLSHTSQGMSFNILLRASSMYILSNIYFHICQLLSSTRCDPCFPNLFSSFVYCFYGPWKRHLVKIFSLPGLKQLEDNDIVPSIIY